MIIVDTREPMDIAEAIEERAAEYERTGLEVGDYLVGDFIIERKDTADFFGRMTTEENDIWLQMMRTVAAAENQDCRAVLLLEGEWADAQKWAKLPINYVASTVGGLHTLGLDIVHMPDKAGSVYYITSLEKDSVKADPGKIRNTPTVDPELMPIYLTQGFERIGKKASLRLLERFGSFHAIVNAEIPELMEVDGIGEKTATRLYEDCRKVYQP